MHIQRLDPAKLTDAYNIKCQFVYPWEGVVTPPFGGGWAVVEPGKETKHHNHQEGETFIIVQGRGEMRIGDETVEVGPGTVVYQPPYDGHVIRNTSETEDLVFFGLYWEDRNLWEGRREDAVLAAKRPRRALVTAAPPTPNGSIHLGHLSGPYLAADVLTRYLRLRGVDAVFGCGTDDHFSHVKTRAEELGLPPASRPPVWPGTSPPASGPPTSCPTSSSAPASRPTRPWSRTSSAASTRAAS